MPPFNVIIVGSIFAITLSASVLLSIIFGFNELSSIFGSPLPFPNTLFVICPRSVVFIETSSSSDNSLIPVASLYASNPINPVTIFISKLKTNKSIPIPPDNDINAPVFSESLDHTPAISIAIIPRTQKTPHSPTPGINFNPTAALNAVCCDTRSAKSVALSNTALSGAVSRFSL